MLVTILVAGAFGVLLKGVDEQNQDRRDRQKVDASIADARALQGTVFDLQTGLRGFAITGQAPFLRPYLQGKRELPILQRRLWLDTPTHNRPLLRDLLRRIDAYANDYLGRQMRAIQVGGIEAAKQMIRRGEGLRRTEEIRRRFNAFYDRQAADAEAARKAADSAGETAKVISIAALILTPLLIALVTLRMAYTVVRPVKDLSVAARRVAAGDLSARVNTRGNTEIATLERSFNAMAMELQRSNGKLTERNAELEAFTYSVSHDLRAPLRSIDGFSQALVEDCSDVLDEQGLDYLGRIRRAAGRMSEQIDDLLRLSRVSRSEVRREPVDVTALAREVVEELSEAEPERAVKVRVEEDLGVEADRQLLRIALENLIGNAWKFTSGEESPRIEVRSERVGDEIAFVVRDNGAGFDMAYADKLFGVFQRLHSVTEFEGTGVGLATVQRIVNKHDGRVWAKAEVGRGATFLFTLGK